MNRFKVRLISSDGDVEFEFSRMFTSAGPVFYVSTIHDLKPILFTMKRDVLLWRIIDAPEVPQWIHNLEEQLSAVIKEYIEGESS